MKKAKRQEEQKNGGSKILIAILILAILIAGTLFAFKIYKDRQDNLASARDIGNIYEEKTKKEIQIFKGTDRPIAVMLDNHPDVSSHAGLNNAYIVYEIIVEGGISRLMPVFKNVDLDKIGPIRSARHYFLDYALENDAIYVHYGWSPQAQSDISRLNVNNINGISESSTYFWRVNDRYSPHDVVSDTEKILSIAERKEYKTKSMEESILDYVADEFDLENSETADEITIPYSDSYTVNYKYDEQTKRYIRYQYGKQHTDWVSKEPVTTKNIIITFATNYTLNDGEGKGRQGIENIGDLEGYYITNGKAIKIVCSKSSRSSKTIYKDLNGNIININDGNTFIQICPKNAKVKLTKAE